jgi:hypothetical protein
VVRGQLVGPVAHVQPGAALHVEAALNHLRHVTCKHGFVMQDVQTSWL